MVEPFEFSDFFFEVTVATVSCFFKFFIIDGEMRAC